MYIYSTNSRQQLASKTDRAPAYNRVPWRIEMVDLKKLRRLLRLHVMSLLLVTYSFQGYFENISGIPIESYRQVIWYSLKLILLFSQGGGNEPHPENQWFTSSATDGDVQVGIYWVGTPIRVGRCWESRFNTQNSHQCLFYPHFGQKKWYPKSSKS